MIIELIDKELYVIRSVSKLLREFYNSDYRDNKFEENLANLKNYSLATDKDAWPYAAYVIGSCLCAWRNKEFCGVEEVAEDYPLLRPYMYSDPSEYAIENLVDYMALFVQLCETQIPSLGLHNEETYKKLRK